MSGVVVCDQEIAQNLDKRLRNQARGVAHSMERFKALIDEAKARCIYPVLGFKSWTAYIADVIGKEMHQLPADDRRQIVVLLAGEGMSNRVIADAVGVTEITVRRDQDQVRHNVAPRPIPVDSNEHAAIHEHLRSDREKREAWQRAGESDKVVPITGRDGKTYPAAKHGPRPDVPKPKPPSSTLFGDKFYRALSQLQEYALQLEILSQKDEFAANHDRICREHRQGVVWAHEVISRVLAKLNTDQGDLFGEVT